MRGLAGAWAVGEALVIWRQVHRDHRMPVPGQLIAVTGLFAAFAFAADAVPGAAGVISAVAWGLDVAGVLNLWPKGLGGQITTAASKAGAPTKQAGSSAGGLYVQPQSQGASAKQYRIGG